MKETKNRNTLKLLCVSDEKDPLVYSPNIKERYSDVDAVIGAGDLPMEYYGFIVSMLNKPLFFVFGNHQLKHFKRFKKPDHMTFEFHDQMHASNKKKSYELDYFGSTYIGGKVKYVKELDVIIAGMGGSYRYNNGENQFTEFQMYMKLLKLFPKLLYNRMVRGRWVDIFVAHAPPFGIHDQEDRCHRGFSAFLWFMRVFSPKYLLHGHIHLLDLNEKRADTYRNTQVINVFQQYILEVERNG